eukprot:2497755-Rhodomonas_salina.3
MQQESACTPSLARAGRTHKAVQPGLIRERQAYQTPRGSAQRLRQQRARHSTTPRRDECSRRKDTGRVCVCVR